MSNNRNYKSNINLYNRKKDKRKKKKDLPWNK